MLSGDYTRHPKTQSSSSPLSSSSSFRFCSFRLRSPFLDLSSFSHSLLADSLFRSGKIRLKTSEYHSTGWPSMPSLMFYNGVSLLNSSMESNASSYLGQFEPVAQVILREDDHGRASSSRSYSLLPQAPDAQDLAGQG